MLDKFGNIIGIIASEATAIDSIEKDTGINIVLERSEDFMEDFFDHQEGYTTDFEVFVNRYGSVIISNFEGENYALIKDGHVVVLKFAKLSTVPDTIASFTELRCLEIFKCKQANIETWISTLSALVSLSINFTAIKKIPEAISALTQLKYLDLSSCSLTEVPPQIGALANLRKLQLGGNAITTLPDEIAKLLKLDLIMLGANALVSIPSTIGALTHLVGLYLPANQLDSFPEVICMLPCLQSLDLSQNKITEIPASISSLASHLKQLYLRDNQLSSLPDTIGELVGLLNLDVSGNRLNTFPPSIVKINKLQNLQVYGNPLGTLTNELVAWITPFRMGQNNRPRPSKTRVQILKFEDIWEKDLQVNADIVVVTNMFLNLSPSPNLKRTLHAEFRSSTGDSHAIIINGTKFTSVEASAGGENNYFLPLNGNGLPFLQGARVFGQEIGHKSMKDLSARSPALELVVGKPGEKIKVNLNRRFVAACRNCDEFINGDYACEGWNGTCGFCGKPRKGYVRLGYVKPLIYDYSEEVHWSGYEYTIHAKPLTYEKSRSITCVEKNWPWLVMLYQAGLPHEVLGPLALVIETGLNGLEPHYLVTEDQVPRSDASKFRTGRRDHYQNNPLIPFHKDLVDKTLITPQTMLYDPSVSVDEQERRAIAANPAAESRVKKSPKTSK